MKRLLFLLLTISCVAQENKKTSIDSLDLINPKEVVIFMKHKDETLKPVKISFTLKNNDLSVHNVDFKKVNIITLTSFYHAMYSCKNTYTFIARNINFYYDEKHNAWFISTEFTAQNDYGATKDGTDYSYFSPDGSKELSADEFFGKVKNSEPETVKKAPEEKETSQERRKRKRAEFEAKKKNANED